LSLAVVLLVASEAKSAETPLALEGYCPVCIVEGNKWVKGNPEFSTTYDGKQYNFPSAKLRQTFLANPVKYVPALGGDCTVCFARSGERAPGNIRFSVRHKGRLYLFPNDEMRQTFKANPGQYENVDLAAGGNCVVCRMKADKRMPGKPEFTAVYKGMRYQFPSDTQRQMFLASPAKYVKATSESQSSLESATSQEIVFSGTSNCAACEYGVHPIKASNTLGLAVEASDGTVYIVEDAHELYPKVYEDRFDNLKLQVRGKVIKTEGKFVWVESSDLKIL